MRVGVLSSARSCWQGHISKGLGAAALPKTPARQALLRRLWGLKGGGLAARMSFWQGQRMGALRDVHRMFRRYRKYRIEDARKELTVYSLARLNECANWPCSETTAAEPHKWAQSWRHCPRGRVLPSCGNIVVL